MQELLKDIYNEVKLNRETTNANALILKSLDKEVNGNGKPGLVEDQRSLEKKVDTNKWYTLIGFILITAGGAGSGVAFHKLLSTMFVR